MLFAARRSLAPPTAPSLEIEESSQLTLPVTWSTLSPRVALHKWKECETNVASCLDGTRCEGGGAERGGTALFAATPVRSQEGRGGAGRGHYTASGGQRPGKGVEGEAKRQQSTTSYYV